MASIPTLELAVEMDDLQWQQAVNLVSDKAYRKFADLYHSRLAAGTALALNRTAVKLDVNNIGHVKASKTGWYTVNDTCDCGDVTTAKAPDGWCKHKFAANIVRVVLQQPCDSLFMNPEEFFEDEASTARADDVQETIRHAHVAAPSSEAHAEDLETGDVLRIPRQFLERINGKPFVKCDGLVQMAHERGLVSLDTTVVYVDATLAVCQCVARFQDGLVVTDIGDATERNVKAHLKEHFIRIAATRATARALRRALNIAAVAVEELGEAA